MSAINHKKASPRVRSVSKTHQEKKISPFFKRFRGRDDIERMTKYTLANALRPKREGTIFEHFLVVGLPASTKSMASRGRPEIHKATVLYQFPSPDVKPMEHQHVAEFCFPSGVEAQCVERTQSASGKLELMYGQLSRMEETDNSYIFLMTGETPLYGVCVAQNELIEESVTFLDHHSTQSPPLSRSKHDMFAPRCYCLLSKFPFFQLHFEVLYGLLARERLRRIAFAVGVTEDEKLHIQKDGDEIKELIASYYAKSVPKEGKSLTFNLPRELRAIEFVCPPGDEDKQLSDWGLMTLFKLFSLENILSLFKAIMLETQMIVICQKKGILSAVMLSLLPLMRPYVFQGPFVPLLPASLIDFLEAPIPYVMGILKAPEEPRYMDGKIIVNISENKITFPDGPLPSLPQEKKLIDSLIGPWTEAQKGNYQANPYLNLTKDLTVVSEICQAFKSYQCWMMDEVIIKSIEEASSSFDLQNAEMFEEMVHNARKSYQPFLKSFLATQQFNSYAEKLMEILVRRGLVQRAHSRSFSTSDLWELKRSKEILIGGTVAEPLSQHIRSGSLEKVDRQPGIE